MRSDTVHVTNQGDGMSAALAQAEATARFRGLSDKPALHLRLLAEEMLGMLRAITDSTEADFWIDAEGDEYKLHLMAETVMTSKKREKLLSASTSGRNAAAKGVMGKLKDLFATAIESANDPDSGYYAGGWFVPSYGAASIPAMGEIEAEVWSLNQYKASIKGRNEDAPEWDELEKSVVSKLADDVQISIRGGKVEMVIFKKLA